MKLKVITGIVLILLLASMLPLALNIQPVRAEPKTWTVDDDGPADFDSIQEAINAANPGDTVFVHSGTYFEHVVVDKTVWLFGENRETAIIDGNGAAKDLVLVTVDNVTITGFTVRNSGYYESGIEINNAKNMLCAYLKSSDIAHSKRFRSSLKKGKVKPRFKCVRMMLG